METVIYKPIGLIRSPFKEAEGAPIQPSGAAGVRGRIEMEPEYREGLKDLDGFSHIMIFYHFHRVRGFRLQVKPFLDDEIHGVFATRAPRRPNPMGFSVVRLVHMEGDVLYIEDVDVLDGTPLLDIKPYVPDFDAREALKTGWLSGKARNADRVRADKRFQ